MFLLVAPDPFVSFLFRTQYIRIHDSLVDYLYANCVAPHKNVQYIQPLHDTTMVTRHWRLISSRDFMIGGYIVLV